MSKSPKKSRSKKSTGVGYGKPPPQHRFKPGQSGNPRGRPKTSPDISELAARELKRQRHVKIDGQQLSIRTAEFLMKKLVADAAQGNLPALKQILALALPFQQKERRKEIEYTKIHPGMSDKEAADAYFAMLHQPLYDE